MLGLALCRGTTYHELTAHTLLLTLFLVAKFSFTSLFHPTQGGSRQDLDWRSPTKTTAADSGGSWLCTKILYFHLVDLILLSILSISLFIIIF